jgi:hypothetical protein
MERLYQGYFRWMGHVACMGVTEVHRILVRKTYGKIPFGRQVSKGVRWIRIGCTGRLL